MKNIIGVFRDMNGEGGVLKKYLKRLRVAFFVNNQVVKRGSVYVKSLLDWDGVQLSQINSEGETLTNYHWAVNWSTEASSTHHMRETHLKRILKGMRKNPERFITIVRGFNRVNSKQMGDYLTQRERKCFITAEKTPFYRLGGSNTYTVKNGAVLSLENQPLSRGITNNLRECRCGRNFTKWAVDGAEASLKYHDGMGHNLCPECSSKVKNCSLCDRVGMDKLCSACETHQSVDLHSWGYTPPFWKYGSYDGKGVVYSSKLKNSTQYLQGLEFEFEFPNGESLREMSKFLKSEMNSDFVYFTTDGSLNDGIELHTQPASLEAVKRINWDKMYSLNACFRSERNGVHVHTNREAYKPLHLGKIAKFHRKCTGLTMAVADRMSVGQFSDYARFNTNSLLRIEREAVRLAKRGSKYFSSRLGDRTDAINCTKSTTIEFRWGGGCEKKADLFIKLEYIDAVFKYTQNCSNLEINGKAFGEWVRGEKTYPNLISWLQSKEGLKAVEFSGSKPSVFR